MVVLAVKKLKTFKEKIKGLVGEEKVYPVMFEARWGIHTFGMKVGLDILILDNRGKVVVAKENLAPRRIFLWNPIYKIALELPTNTIKKKNIKMGEKVELTFDVK